jgi:cold shock CspA family protein
MCRNPVPSTKAKPPQSRFAFGRDDPETVPEREHVREDNQSTQTADDNTTPRERGIVARLIGEAPIYKYGFIQTTKGTHLFFHWKGLSVEAMACIQCGTEVEFDTVLNQYNKDKKQMAVNLTVKGSENKFNASRGILAKWLPDKQYGFIRADTDAGVFAHRSAFTIGGDSLISDVSELQEGMEVLFDRSVNYRSVEPKPFAVNVKVTAMAPAPAGPSARPSMPVAGSPTRWTPSAAVMRRRSSGEGDETCDAPVRTAGNTSTKPCTRNSTSRSSSHPMQRSSSWREKEKGAADCSSPCSSLFQGYVKPKATEYNTHGLPVHNAEAKSNKRNGRNGRDGRDGNRGRTSWSGQKHPTKGGKGGKVIHGGFSHYNRSMRCQHYARSTINKQESFAVHHCLPPPGVRNNDAAAVSAY